MWKECKEALLSPGKFSAGARDHDSHAVSLRQHDFLVGVYHGMTFEDRPIPTVCSKNVAQGLEFLAI